jgi:hypothetical protein
MSKVCKIKGCNKKYLARGFCRLHYDRWYFGIIDEDGNQLREIFSTKPKGESWKLKMKEVMKDPEIRKKCGWSKGLTKETSEGVRNSSNARKGLIPRNKNLTMEEEFGTEKAAEIKQQISDSMKKAFENDPSLYEKCSKARKGKPSPMKDQQHTSEGRENIKKGMANRDPGDRKRWIDSLSGENSPNYRGGISYLPYGFKFDSKLKRRIRERDGNVCQLCFLTNKEHKEKYGDSLHCHHIDHDKQNCEEYNLITLCNVCNGKVNKDRKKWTNYFQILLSVIDEQDYLMELTNAYN